MRCCSIGDRKTLIDSIKVTDGVQVFVDDNLANRSNRLRQPSRTLAPIRLVNSGLCTASLDASLVNATMRDNEAITCCNSELLRKKTRNGVGTCSVDLSFLTRQRANIPLPPLSQANIDVLTHRSHHRRQHHRCRPSTCSTMTSPARRERYASRADDQKYQAYPTNNGQCDAKRCSTNINNPGTNQQKTSCSFAGVVERAIQKELRRKNQPPGELLQALYEEYCASNDESNGNDDDDDDLYDGAKLKAKYLQMRGEFNERVKQMKAVCKAAQVFKRKYNSSLVIR